MARKSALSTSAATATAPPTHTLILDHGAHTLKASLVADNPSDPPSGPSDPPSDPLCHLISNTLARSARDHRTYIGAELLRDCADYGALAFRRPVEKGYVVNWEGEKAIWEHSLLGSLSTASAPAAAAAAATKTATGTPADPGTTFAPLRTDPAVTTLLWTEAPGAPAALQRNADEMVFEEFGFAAAWRAMGTPEGGNEALDKWKRHDQS